MPMLTGNAPTGTPTWIDYMCNDVARTGDFFSQLLGWNVPPGDPAYGGYTSATLDGELVSGLGPLAPGQAATERQQVYLAADDLQLAIDKCRASGGTIMDMEGSEIGDVGELGRMAVVTDPAGATFGLWEGKQHNGFGVFDEVGAPSWFEVLSRDVESTKAFLTEAFGFDFTSDERVPGYEMAKLPGADDHVFGVMEMSDEMPGDVPSCWVGYYTVADADQAVAKVQELGGDVKMRGEIPSGYWVNATTPDGAFFGLYASK